MIKTILANAYVKKALIFVVSFATALVLIGSQLLDLPDGPPASGEVGQLIPVQAQADSPLLMLELSESELLGPVSLGFGEIAADDEDFWIQPATPEYGGTNLWEEPKEESEPETSEEEAAPKNEPKTHGGIVYLSSIPLSHELQSFTYTRCQEVGIDYPLVLAIMWCESRFTVNAVNVNTNGTRDSGLMQINDVNKGWLAREHGITNLFDPHQNIRAGTEMLSKLVHKYGEHNALMAYQYGEAGMQQKLAQGINTSNAINRLYKKRAEYRALLDNTAQTI